MYRNQMPSHFELRSSVKPRFAVKHGDFQLPRGWDGRYQLSAQVLSKTSMENTIWFHIILSVQYLISKFGKVCLWAVGVLPAEKQRGNAAHTALC